MKQRKPRTEKAQRQQDQRRTYRERQALLRHGAALFKGKGVHANSLPMRLNSTAHTHGFSSQLPSPLMDSQRA